MSDEFADRMAAVMDRIRKILDEERMPKLPENVPHQYQDKYSLAETLANTAIITIINAIEALNLNKQQLDNILDIVHNQHRPIVLRLKAQENTTFVRERKRRFGATVRTYNVKVTHGNTERNYAARTPQSENMDYFWNYNVSYQLYFYMGAEVDNPLAILQDRSASVEIVSYSKECPRPAEKLFRDPIDVDCTTFFKQISLDGRTAFQIKRDNARCHTPKNNLDVDRMLTQLQKIASFCHTVETWIRADVLSLEVDNPDQIDLSAVNSNAVFNPVIPLFSETESKEEQSNLTGIVDLSFPLRIPDTKNVGVWELSELVSEQKRSITKKKEELSLVFKSRNKSLGSIDEAFMSCILLHMKDVSSSFCEGINYIEYLLGKQLIAAIGKVLTPTDFTKYMIFHNRKLFISQYEPKPFSYAIRRPDHYPEGILSIEAKYSGESLLENIYTICKTVKSVEIPMIFSLNSATKVSFYGERYLHSYVSHQFSGQSGISLVLNARAGQFSCFVLLVGTVASASLFIPKGAIIIQNKDDLQIPLLCEALPTAKEFRDAIVSLSPEQQRFAKAYRSLQLEGTLFGICILQIKPQLEKLLNLENDSLTQEIRLTQDLIELFIKYQIPSDLLSVPLDKMYDSKEDKIDIVKQNVKATQDMLQISRKRELELQNQRAEFVHPSFLEYESNPAVLPSLSRRGVPELITQSIVLDEHPGDMMLRQKRKSGKHGKAKELSEIKQIEPSMAASAPGANVNSAPEGNSSNLDGTSESKSAQMQMKPSHLTDGTDVAGGLDYTLIPALIDENLGKFDSDNALRATIISVGDNWTRSSQPTILSPLKKETINSETQDKEKDKAYDLLDCLSRSGNLPFDHASLHILLGFTQCFEKTLANTVIQNNVNPIESVERSTLIVSATIQNENPLKLVKPQYAARFSSLEFLNPSKASLPRS